MQRIAEALRAAGVEVWFDRNELVGGDAWDAKIRGQIASCALFVPVISANTQARLEGYFRIEWKLAARRTHAMATAKAFLLPVVIDATRDAEAHVPDEFREVQWTRLRPVGSGAASPAEFEAKALAAFGARVGKLLGGEAVGAGSEVGARLDRAQDKTAAEGRGRATPLRQTSRPWLGPAIIGAAAVVGLALWQPWRATEKPAPTASPASGAASAAPVSEARRLVAQARTLFEDGDHSNHENFFLADDLLKRAVILDPADGEVWAAQAQVSAQLYNLSYDRSGARREAMRVQAERAVKLAPDSFEAQLALASYLAVAGASTAPEAVPLLNRLIERAPRDRRIYQALGMAHTFAGKVDEAAAAFRRGNDVSGGDPEGLGLLAAQFFWHGRYAEMGEAVAQSLAIRPVGRTLIHDVNHKLVWLGDLEAAAEALGRWPAWLLREDRGAFVASQVWMWRREPDKAVEALNRLTRDFINEGIFLGPRSGLLALAHEMANRPQAARTEWINARNAASRVVAEDPANKRALVWKGIALARLGETKEAAAILEELEQLKELRSDFWSSGAGGALLRIAVGRGNEVAAKFDAGQRSNVVRHPLPTPQAALRLNPVFDPIRATPEFQRWMAAAPAPEAKKESRPTAMVAPALNEKSLVVLPLENLSPDPENAFFTDGMHAEIISTLSQIPDLKVVSRDSALTLKGSTASLTEKAQKLGVSNVITGSVRRAGNTVRIQLELRRAGDEAVLWSLPKGDRDLKDVLGLQSEVADQVARVLQARGATGSFVLARFTTQNSQAYDLYIRALAIFNSAESGERSLQTYLAAIEKAEQAMAIDPSFAGAASLLANAQWFAYRYDQDPRTRLHHAAESRRWAETAARLVPGGAGDYGLASYYGQLERDYSRGLTYARNVVRALPNEAAAYNYVAIFSSWLGQEEEARIAYRRAIELDPLRPVYWTNYLSLLADLRRLNEFQQDRARYHESTRGQDLPAWQYVLAGELPVSVDRLNSSVRIGWLWRARRVAEVAKLAVAELSKSETKDLDRLVYLRYQTDALQKLGRKVDAEESAVALMALVQKLAEIAEVGPSQKHFQLALALARLGRADEAVSAARRHLETVRTGAPRILIQRELEVAELFAYLNRPRECVELLAKLLRVRSGLSVPMLKVDPVWDSVREDAGFKALLADPKNSAPL